MHYIKDGIFLANHEGRITYIDRSLRRMLGIPEAEETDPEAIRSRIQFAGAIPMAEVLETALADGDWSGEAVGRVGDGHALYLEVRAHRGAPASDPSAGVVVFLRNATRDQALETKVLEIQQMELVEKLIRGIAHEFRNLLTIITAYGTLLAYQVKDEEAKDGIAKIMETAMRAETLTSRMVAVTRRPQPDVESSDLEEVFSEIAALTAKSMPSNVVVKCCPPRRMPLVRVDTAALIRSVIHLALNGCEAMPEGGTLTIECGSTEVSDQDAEDFPVNQPGRYVVISVTDTGFGMSPDVRGNLFEPFFTTKEKGTGLGLCSVKKSIDAVGGELGIYSEPGHGTCARIYLPVAPTEDDPADEPAADSGNRAGRTILVVDDDEIVRKVARRMLEHAGFRVLTAPNGEEALALARGPHAGIDAVLLDLVLPDQSGLDVRKSLAEISPNLPVLLTSGFSTTLVDGVPGKDGIPTPCIPKPFTQSDLIQNLDALLAPCPPATASNTQPLENADPAPHTPK